MGCGVVEKEKGWFYEKSFVKGDMYFLFIGYVFGFFVDGDFVEV